MRHLHHQTSQTKLWAVIPAAGSGSRFSKTELKQYQYIQDATVIEHTVKRLSQLP
ncbi:2-C-methyl-D-erythritol 4-phosphate cytidylyltransferase, partial [Klebsiella pneumoniae]